MSSVTETIASLRKRVDAFHKLARPWSIAELRVTEDEYADLREWYACLEVLYRQHYWLALILMVAVNRRTFQTDDEKTLWPSIYGYLYELNRTITNTLFISSSMNPKPGLNEYIKSTAYSNESHEGIGLSYLRDLFPYEAGKNYYNFMNLQCGLTKRTISKLQDWVSVYYDNPDDYFSEHRVRVAVRCLLSGHIDQNTRVQNIRSQTFVSLWNTIRRYTSGDIEQPDFRKYLTESPWVLPEWVDEIIKSTPKPKKRYAPNTPTNSPGPEPNVPTQWLGTPRIIYTNALIRFEIPVAVDILGVLPAIKNLSQFEPFTVRCGDDEITYSWNKGNLEPDLNHKSNTLCGYLGEHHNVTVTIHDEEDHELASELVSLVEFDGEPCLYAEDGTRISMYKRLDQNKRYLAIWPSKWDWSCNVDQYSQHSIEYCLFSPPLVISDVNGEEIWRSSCHDNGQLSAEEQRKLIEFTPTEDGFTIFTRDFETEIHSVYIAGYTDGFELAADRNGYVWKHAGSVTRTRIPIRVKLQGHGNPFTPYDDAHHYMNPCEFIAYSETPVDQMSWIQLSETDYVEIDAKSDRPAIRYWPGADQRLMLSGAVLCEDALYGGTVSIGYVTEQGDVNVSGRPKGMGGRYSLKWADGSFKTLPFVSVYRGCVAVNEPTMKLQGSALTVRLRHEISLDRVVSIRIWDCSGISEYGACIASGDGLIVRVDKYDRKPYLVTVMADGGEVGWATANDWYGCYGSDMNPSDLVENLASMHALVLDPKSHGSLYDYFLGHQTDCVTIWSAPDSNYTKYPVSNYLLKRCFVNDVCGLLTAVEIDGYCCNLMSDDFRMDTLMSICHKYGPVISFKMARWFSVPVDSVFEYFSDHLYHWYVNKYILSNDTKEEDKQYNKNVISMEKCIEILREKLPCEDILGISAILKSSPISLNNLAVMHEEVYRAATGNDMRSASKRIERYVSEIAILSKNTHNTVTEYLLAKLCERWLMNNA